VKATDGIVDLTITIVNTNNRVLLGRCLDTIATSVGALSHEVIVVDNASTDGSADLLHSRYPHVKVIRNPARDGYGRSHNRAIAASTGTHVLILNEDMEMLGDAVEMMVRKACTVNDLGVLGCRILNPDKSLQHSCFRAPRLLGELFEAIFPYTVAFTHSPLRSKMYEWRHDTEREVDIVLGCCMLLPRRTLETVGAFDPEFYIYSEEHDLCKRARDRGFKVLFTPDAEMIHFGGQTTKHMSLRMALIQLDSRIRYFRKHHGRLHALLLRAILVLAAALRLAGWSMLYLLRRGPRALVAGKLSEYFFSLKFVLGFGR
jgi:GT2 family glycosyltransferase